MRGTVLAARRHSIARSSRSAGFKPRPLKNLFTANGGWAGLLEAGGLRAIEVESVSKMLACDPGCEALHLRQWALFACQIPVQHLPLPGLSLSCGKKATDQWIAVQHNRLPDCAWYHLVFTVPDTLWPVFFHNRSLLDALCRLAADNLLYAGKRRGLRIGLFGALHTYGRRLNWHAHVHLSATAGGLDEQGLWKNLTFHEKAMRQRWMWNVRNHLLEQWGQLTMPPELAHITCESDWRNLVLTAGGQHWHIYLSKKTENGRKTVNYLGRYLKKPPISGSRLAHYTSVCDVELHLPGSSHADLSAGVAEPDRHAAPGGAAHPGEAFPDDPLFWFSGQPGVRAVPGEGL